MEKLPSVLIYEALGYHPQAIPCVQILNRSISDKIKKRVDIFHTLLEEVYGFKNYREMTFDQCLIELKQEEPIIYSYETGKPTLVAYNVATKTKEQFPLEMDEVFGLGTIMTFIPGFRSLITTGGHSSGWYSKKCQLIDIESKAVQLLANCLDDRTGHTAQYINNTLFIFGGYAGRSVLSCERFNWKDWQYIPSLADKKEKPGSVIYAGKVYIAGYGSKFIEIYHPDDNIFTSTGEILWSSDANTVCLGLQNKFYVLHRSVLQTINLDTLTSEEETKSIDNESWWTHVSTLTYNNQIYFVHRDSSKFPLYQMTDSGVQRLIDLKVDSI